MLRLKLHPLATPPAEDSPKLAAMVQDIKLHGQALPMLGIKGRVNGDIEIFDGALRLRACQLAGVVPRYDLWDGDAESLPQRIESLKLLREHLSPSQRAAYALAIEEEFAGEAGKRERAGKKPDPVANLPQGSQSGRSRDLAAAICDCSPRYITDLKSIRDADADLFAQVRSGKLNINQAKSELRRREIHRQLKAINRDVGQIKVKNARWQITTANCVAEFPTLLCNHFRLIFADPQYNIGIDYGHGKKADQLSNLKYEEMGKSWLAEAHRTLTPDGSLWIVINDGWAPFYILEAKALGFTLRSWIKWYETFGVNCTNNFNRTSRHVLYFVKDSKRFVFNPIIFSRKSDRQTIYGDKRGNPNGKLLDDVWIIPRLVSGPERLPTFPTQLPLALVRPIVEGCTEIGDDVLDPFSGSGTTGAAAIACGRRYLGIEINPEYAELSRGRLVKQQQKGGK